jgi:hypothetical protein
MEAYKGDNPRGDATNQRDDGRLSRRVVHLHDRVESAAEVILSGLQSIKVVSKSWRKRKHSIRVRA